MENNKLVKILGFVFIILVGIGLVIVIIEYLLIRNHSSYVSWKRTNTKY